MAMFAFTRPRAAMSAGVAAVVLGLSASVPAGAVGARGFDDGGAVHHRARTLHRPGHTARGWRGRVFGYRHHHAHLVALDPGPRSGVAGVPAGYASDESPYNVQAEDDDFDTGAFYGCLHNVLTAGGYRPEATCD